MSQGRHGTLSQRDGVGGWGGRWWWCVEGRRRNVEGEEGASALRRPFGRPSRGLSGTLLVLVLPRCLSGAFRGPLPAQSCGKERAPHHDHGKRRRRLTTCQSCHSNVRYSLSLLLCVDLACARSTQKNHILKKSKNGKMSYCSAHRTFRRHHAALHQFLRKQKN